MALFCKQTEARQCGVIPEPIQRRGIELGFVLTVWKGHKDPRPNSYETRISSCVAFRVVSLEKQSKDDPETDWFCNSKTLAWVVRAHGLVAILDCERCALSAL